MTLASSSYTLASSLCVKPALVLAPMSGVTTSAFRRLIRECNPNALGLVVTEFVSCEALTRQVPRSLQMISFRPEERPLGIQIFGFDIGRMTEAARMCVDQGADLLDINCGCPAPKVVRKGGGCELMRQPTHLAKLLKSVRAAVKIPLTIKMRAGWDDNSKNAMQIARIAEDEGLDGITIHGRTKAAAYRGKADWEVVSEVARAVKIPVCGSGDVSDYLVAERLLIPPVSGLFIGRQSLANPFIFTDIIKRQTIKRSEGVLLAVLRRYVELLLEEMAPRGAIGKVKQLVSQMARGFSWRQKLCCVNNFDEQLEILSSLVPLE